MQPCTEHWAAMRKKIQDLGLWAFVAGSPEEAHARAFREIGGEVKAGDWDPLMSMLMNFNSRVLASSGLYVMTRKDGEPTADGKDAAGKPWNDGHFCPLCIVQSTFDLHNTPNGRCSSAMCTITITPGEVAWDRQWIEGCGDAMLDHAKILGLVVAQ